MKKSIISNISFNFIIEVITYVFSFLTVMYAARVLRPDAFGRVSFASSYAGYFVMLANLGLPIYAMRTCAEKAGDRKELSKTVSELWSINVLLSVISAVFFLLTIVIVPKLRSSSLLLVIYGSALFFQMIGCTWLFRGLEKFRFLAVSSFVCKFIAFVLIILFVQSDANMALYAFLSVLTGYGSNIICFLMLHRNVDLSFHIRINREHFKPLLTFFLMSCAVYVYSSLDLTMLGFMRTDYETGLYQLAAKGRSALTILGGLVWSSTLPLASKLWREGYREHFAALAGKCIVAVCGIQLAVTVICFAAAKEIILLAGGREYIGAVNSFRILLLSLVPVGASNILGGQVLIPSGNERRLLHAELLGAAFNFVANLILIPRFSIAGAAFTTTVSEIIVWIICAYYVKKDLGIDLGFVLIGKTMGKLSHELTICRARMLNRAKRDRLPYYCPCCDTYLKDFIDGGYKQHPEMYNPGRYEGMDQNVICPVCRSLPRHRILVSWMAQNKEEIKGKRILHFAQERSLRLWMDRQQITAVTADLYNPADRKINLEDTGLEDDSFDLIICNHVLEHVADYHKALRELYRIVRPEGRVIISFPVDPRLETVSEADKTMSEQDRVRHFGQRDHMRVFGIDSPKMLENYGFEVSEIRGEDYDRRIKPIIGPADYDYNVLWILKKHREMK